MGLVKISTPLHSRLAVQKRLADGDFSQVTANIKEILNFVS
jgi:hypothetical protein